MPRQRLPKWFKIDKPNYHDLKSMESLVHNKHLNTICHEANCPNKGVCFKQKLVTFMILGKNCTRNCKFCNVTFAKPTPVDSDEPIHIAEAALDLGLKHVVVTSVTRDDLVDGGAQHFANVIYAIKQKSPETSVEVLIPDMHANREHLKIITDAKPDVIGHNLETISKFYVDIMPTSDYQRSLNTLKIIKELAPDIYTKSSIMAGFGETEDDIIGLLFDLLNVNCDIFTMGQYLQPSFKHIDINTYMAPETFKRIERKAISMGFKAATCGPLVRSSFNALEIFNHSKEAYHALY